MDDYSELLGNGSTKKRDISPWLQGASVGASIIASAAGMRYPGFNWLFYLGGVMLVISVALMIYQSPVGAWFCKFISRIKDRRTLSRHALQYCKLVEDLESARILWDEVDDIGWGSNTPCNPGSPVNSFHDLWRQSSALHGAAKVICLNLGIAEIIRQIDSFLYCCDETLRNGGAKHQSEQKLNSLLKRLHEYEDAIAKHNKFCTGINKKLTSVRLTTLHPHEHGFDWISAKPIQ